MIYCFPILIPWVRTEYLHELVLKCYFDRGRLIRKESFDWMRCCKITRTGRACQTFPGGYYGVRGRVVTWTGGGGGGGGGGEKERWWRGGTDKNRQDRYLLAGWVGRGIVYRVGSG